MYKFVVDEIVGYNHILKKEIVFRPGQIWEYTNLSDEMLIFMVVKTYIQNYNKTVQILTTKNEILECHIQSLVCTQSDIILDVD